MRTAGLIAAVLVLAVVLLGCKGTTKPLGRETETNSLTFVPPGSLRDERVFQDYVIRIYENWEERQGALEILRQSRRIYVQEGVIFDVSRYGGAQKARLPPVGQDVMGDGKPDLVVSEFTAGAHCCYTVYVFEIGEEFRKIATIHGEDGAPDFTDMDGDAIPEVVLHDFAFAYWRTAFGFSPAPQVILRFRDGAYRVAGDLMRKPAPAPTELETRARKVRDDWAEEYHRGFWGFALDLIYSGHAGLAWQFLEMAWPLGYLGKGQFLSDFRARLSKSPYWPEIQGLSAD
ncbi:MAG: VCBS repeat-containing protein [Chloroflexi bacterium]|nr:VCBS repeat-containing protein [Chloroflexota bacterium]